VQILGINLSETVYLEDKESDRTMYAMYISRNAEALPRTHSCRGKAISITHSECVSAALLSSMQSACAVLYSHIWLVRLYSIFPHYLIKGTTFGKKFTGHKICVLTFSTTSP
jgi:hypothetical protein